MLKNRVHILTHLGILSLIVAVLTLIGLPKAALAADDGRIDVIPWVNGWGAVAVYCIDQTGHSARSYSGGEIRVLNSDGQQLLAANEAALNAAQNTANTSNHNVLIASSTVYRLWAVPNSYFTLSTIPDNEGKTFLGTWQGCTPNSGGTTTQLCSTSSSQGTADVTFQNNTSGTVNLFWVDYASEGCGEVLYCTLNAGESCDIFTYVTHPWRFRDANTGALLKQLVITTTGTYTVTVP